MLEPFHENGQNVPQVIHLHKFVYLLTYKLLQYKLHIKNNKQNYIFILQQLF